jgi:hypothetical protein
LLSGANDESEISPEASAVVVIKAGWSMFGSSVIEIVTGRPGSQCEPVSVTGSPGA